MKKINIIGGGLAGVEAASFLANYGIKVNLYEMKPIKFSPAHKSENLGELVCSNSLKSNLLTNACGLLKEEMRELGSLTMAAAEASKIEGGSSLNVDRDKFSEYITQKILQNPNISVIHEEVTTFKDDEIYIVATGPLGSEDLLNNLRELIGDDFMSFFDASAPIIEKDSINFDIAYYKSRYDEGSASYINCPMSKEQYYDFVNELINAETAKLHDFDTKYFEGCMPVEAMAKRGIDTLRYGPLKPKGLWRGPEDRSFAVVQLRQDTLFGDLYNIVGFQTNLTYPEQKRVFRMIPGLENAKFIRYGLMHRNSYVNAPKVLNEDMSLKANKNIYLAGQFSGVEGYVESSASGIYVAIEVLKRLTNLNLEFPKFTMLGSLMNYLNKANPETFAPMNANFGIMYGVNKSNKLEKANECIEEVREFKNKLDEQTRGTIS